MASETAVRSNTEIVREYTQRVFNEHDPDVASGYLTPEVKWHGGLLGTVKGLENVTEMLRGFIGALPDLHAAEQDMVAAGDTVAVRDVVEATHEGNLLGIAPTGRRVRWDAVSANDPGGCRIGHGDPERTSRGPHLRSQQKGPPSRKAPLTCAFVRRGHGI